MALMIGICKIMKSPAQIQKRKEAEAIARAIAKTAPLAAKDFLDKEPTRTELELREVKEY